VLCGGESGDSGNGRVRTCLSHSGPVPHDRSPFLRTGVWLHDAAYHHPDKLHSGECTLGKRTNPNNVFHQRGARTWLNSAIIRATVGAFPFEFEKAPDGESKRVFVSSDYQGRALGGGTRYYLAQRAR
jgi:hypothetical protein